MRPNTVRAMLGGLAGTTVMTMIMYSVAPMMGMPKMDIAASLGEMMHVGWTMGMLVHFINGTIIFPLIYALLLYRLLPGAPATKGALWGTVLWLLAQTVVMPMMGAGFFTAKMGAPAAIGSLVNHLIYGALLGVIAGGHKSDAPKPTAGEPAHQRL